MLDSCNSTETATLNEKMHNMCHQRLSPTSRGVHFDQDVIAAWFDNGWHHILYRWVHREHQSEGFAVWPVDLIQHCTEKGRKPKCQDLIVNDVSGDVQWYVLLINNTHRNMSWCKLIYALTHCSHIDQNKLNSLMYLNSVNNLIGLIVLVLILTLILCSDWL